MEGQSKLSLMWLGNEIVTFEFCRQFPNYKLQITNTIELLEAIPLGKTSRFRKGFQD